MRLASQQGMLLVTLLFTGALCTEQTVERSVEHVTIARGESISGALERGGVGKDDLSAFVRATKKFRPLAVMPEGSAFELVFDDAHRLASFELQSKPTIVLCVARENDGAMRARARKLEETTRVELVTGEIGRSLPESIEETGEHAALGHLIAALAAKRFTAGDRFRALVEKKYIGDRFVDYGWVRAASIVHKNGETEELFQFMPANGEAGYYARSGKALWTSELAHPVASAVLTSGFGVREDPIGGYANLHQGLDYGAPEGTDVLAARSGIVESAEREADLGNLVTISHGDGLVTRYAHLSWFAPGIKRGARVARGTLLGRIGTTGRSTGPHLHFEVWVRGRPMDPLPLLTRRGAALEDGDRERFAAELTRLQRAIEPRRECLPEVLLASEPIGSEPEPVGSKILEPFSRVDSLRLDPTRAASLLARLDDANRVSRLAVPVFGSD